MAATSARASAPALQNPAYRPADPPPDKTCFFNALSIRRPSAAAGRAPKIPVRQKPSVNLAGFRSVRAAVPSLCVDDPPRPMIPGILPSTACIGSPGAPCHRAGPVRARRVARSASGAVPVTRAALARPGTGHHETHEPHPRPDFRDAPTIRPSSRAAPRRAPEAVMSRRRPAPESSPRHDGADAPPEPHVPVLLAEVVEAQFEKFSEIIY